MTWKWESDGGSLVVYDHTGAEVYRQEGSGFAIPGDMLDVMLNEAEAEFSANGLNGRVFAILRDAAFEQIEEV